MCILIVRIYPQKWYSKTC